MHHKLARAPFDPFMRVESADATCLLDGLHGVRVDDCRARIGVVAGAPTFGVAQRSLQARPEAGAAKLLDLVVHGLP
jgi:hypothetical protein